MNIKWVGAHTNNYQKGRGGKKVEMIVCHWIVGPLASADAVFNNPNRIASAHYGVGGSGQVHQYVRDEDTAYHCGNFDANQRSIGIEHEGGPNVALTDAMYAASAQLIYELCKKHNLPLERSTLKMHKEFKATQCPGTLDLDRLIRLAKEKEKPMQDPLVEIFKSIYIAYYANWPTDEQVEEYKRNGGLPYTFFQNRYLYPERAERDKQVATIRTTLEQTQSYLNDVTAQFNQLKKEIEDIRARESATKEQWEKYEEGSKALIRQLEGQVEAQQIELGRLRNGLKEASLRDLLVAVVDKLFGAKEKS